MDAPSRILIVGAGIGGLALGRWPMPLQAFGPRVLAGYLDTADGRQLIVVVFANHVPAGADFKNVERIGDALGEIAAAAYDSK